jgi:uncharacterized protein
MMLSRRSLLLAVGAVASCPSAAHADPRRSAARLVAAARNQIGVTLSYDPGYTRLAFPDGDVARNKGVCTDVVIRAYRDAFGVDLQALVNADMKRAFAAYPKRWGLRGTDSSIDHRRVPNLQTFFARAGARLAVPTNPASWQAGDVFTCLVGGNLPHIGIVSDRQTRSGRPLIIHNIGRGTQEEDALVAFALTGRYRWKLG